MVTRALISTISWHQWKSQLTSMKVPADLYLDNTSFLLKACRKLRLSCLLFVASAYGMGKEDQKSSGLLLACLATPRTGQDWPKCFIKWNLLQINCCCLFHNVHLIMVDDAQPCTVPAIQICTLAKFKGDVLFSHNFMVLFQTSKQISST